MNNVYFACITCKAYVDAGYRHAYWTLEEPGVVRHGEPVNVKLVRGIEGYWAGARDAQWLADLLPSVREFLRVHAGHDVRYGDEEHIGIPTFEWQGEYPLFEWVNEAGFVLEELPRYWVERLGFRTWPEVTRRIEALAHPPLWWQSEADREAARREFTRLVSLRS